MGGTKETFEAEMGLKQNHGASPWNDQWVINMETASTDSCDDFSESFESSFKDSAKSSSIESVEDDASSSSSSYGPLYELSELMAQLPIKRGLSKYYKGKSQSFGCLESVKSFEDLAKNGNSCKSFRGGLDGKRTLFGPRATITKKSSRKSNLSSLTCTNTLVASCRSPISLKKNL
ncbi:uncharacterized protein LOC142166551 [Nicotiana tabacum]|uniref:Uncharacterized protein LOC142166551 n=2 Tax=Nicotiana TaxID=4085 RepID=A0AC58SAQ1_TOBAC|nr:PREDICTED: uncharacterized protein LOC104241793 [Nicotiana sylvestris]